MKVMIVNSKIKLKSKKNSGVIINLVLDFILYFVTVSMKKYPIHITSTQHLIPKYKGGVLHPGLMRLYILW